MQLIRQVTACCIGQSAFKRQEVAQLLSAASCELRDAASPVDLQGPCAALLMDAACLFSQQPLAQHRQSRVVLHARTVQAVQDDEVQVNMDCSNLHDYDSMLYSQLLNYPGEVLSVLDDELNSLRSEVAEDHGLEIRVREQQLKPRHISLP